MNLLTAVPREIRRAIDSERPGRNAPDYRPTIEPDNVILDSLAAGSASVAPVALCRRRLA